MTEPAGAPGPQSDPAPASADDAAGRAAGSSPAGSSRAGSSSGGAEAVASRPGVNRVWTIPNLLSFLRLLGIPLFLWLLLGPQADGWALVVLAVSAITDWADGKLARLLNQYSRLGELLDPAADRLYILAALVGFVIRDFLPWWVAALIIGRDVLLALSVLITRRYGYAALPVHYLGKAATFVLLYGLPMLLLAQLSEWLHLVALPIAYAFIAWGVVLYLAAGVIYFRQIRWIVRNCPLVDKDKRPTARSVAGG